MKQYKCDQTGTIMLGTPKVTLNGFTRPNDGGILLPEQGHVKHFASRDAFLDWMREAIKQEDDR